MNQDLLRVIKLGAEFSVYRDAKQRCYVMSVVGEIRGQLVGSRIEVCDVDVEMSRGELIDHELSHLARRWEEAVKI